MLYRFAYTAFALSLLIACSQNTPRSEANDQLQPAVEKKVPQQQQAEQLAPPKPTESFADWQSNFRKYALTQGITADTFDTAFKGVTPDEAVVKADYSQPEFTRPVWEYLDSAVSLLRVNNGKKKIIEHATTLTAIQQQYQVDHQVIIAIWGMESGYGSFTGNKQVIRSLATLAYEGRRAKFAKEQLIAALKILQNGDVSPKNMLGSWAGAMGQTQFIPTTYLVHAVDFDNDGHRNIWTSVPDALASTANYLAASNWQYGETWGYQVQLPKKFDYSETDISTKKTVADWVKLGVTLVDGKAIPATEQSLHAAIILPAGARGPAFMVYPNFFAIMKYNNSTSYALAVGLLMDQLKGKKGVIGNWPTEDRPLSRTERIDLQTLLNKQNYDAGEVDGIIGGNTRHAIRSYQQTLGWPADGYPTPALLEKLKSN